MKAYSLIVIFICCICEYTAVAIMPELKRNILNFGYRINFKYEGMISHSFGRFYVVTKYYFTNHQRHKNFKSNLIQPLVILDVDINRSKIPTHYLPNIKNFC